jgi:hypothetical protein
MEMHPVEAALIHADSRTEGKTDMRKLTGAFRDSANAPKMRISYKILEEGTH